jgi:hypothetical protein
MVSGGLGWTDHSRREVIGGYSLEFFERVGKKYGRPIEWRFEPHVAEAVFRDLVQEAGIEVFYRHRLRERTGVAKQGTRVTSIRWRTARDSRRACSPTRPTKAT